jgi:hypothetical protein
MDFIALDKGNLDAITAAWAKAPEILLEEIDAAMAEIAPMLQRAVQELTPTSSPAGASGGGGEGLKGTIYGTHEVVGDQVIGMVASPLSYAEPVELGSKPHMPPIQPLIDWVKVKFGLSDTPIPLSSWDKGESEKWPTSNPKDSTPATAWRKVKGGGIERQSEASKRAWAIAWSIYHHGTPGHGMFHRGLAYNEAAIQAKLNEALTRVAARIGVMV